MKIDFVTKDGKPTKGYLTTTERKAVEFMYGYRCNACRSARNTYAFNMIDPVAGIYGFLRVSGMNRGYVDYMIITA